MHLGRKTPQLNYLMELISQNAIIRRCPAAALHIVHIIIVIFKAIKRESHNSGIRDSKTVPLPYTDSVNEHRNNKVVLLLLPQSTMLIQYETFY